MNDENTYYYDAMDCLESGNDKQALKLLQKALIINRHNVQTLLGIAEIYHNKDNEYQTHVWITKAYDETKRQFPVWPRKMLWGEIENRAYLRTIAHKADFLCDEGKKDEAIELYRLLLKLNPNDNQGIRYILAGIYAGLAGQYINQMFDDANKKQDWSTLENLVKKQNKIHTFWKQSR